MTLAQRQSHSDDRNTDAAFLAVTSLAHSFRTTGRPVGALTLTIAKENHLGYRRPKLFARYSSFLYGVYL